MQVLILHLLPVVAVSVIPLNVLICSLCLERIMRNKVIKSCEIGALAWYLGLIQMLVCGDKLGRLFCVSLSQEVFTPENMSACTLVYFSGLSSYVRVTS